MTVKVSEDVGAWIKSERLRQGFTQKKLAGLAGLGERFLIEVEKGKATSEIGKVLRVISLLGGKIEIQTSERR